MKHIRLFETQAERDSAEIVGPFIIYTKETDKLETEEITPINIQDTPKLMNKVYEWGWAKNPNYMTVTECSLIGNSQLASKAGTASANSGFAGIDEDFSAFKYFTSITSLSAYAFKGAKFTKIRFPETLTSLNNYSLVGGSWIKGTLDLSNTKIQTFTRIWKDTTNNNLNISGIILPETCKIIGDESAVFQFSWTNNNRLKDLLWLKINYIGTDLVAITRNGLCDKTTITQYQNFRIYVPDDLVQAYKTDNITSGNARKESWNTYANKIFSHTQWEEDVANGIIPYNDFAK